MLTMEKKSPAQDMPTHKEVGRMLYNAAHRFHEKTGIEFDLLLSQANLIWLRAPESYDPSKGTKFTTWLTYLLNWELTNYTVAERKKHTQLEYEENFQKPQSKMEELSEDGDLALRIALSAPNWANDGRRRSKALTWMKERLQDLGWGADRISESFTEIREALQ